MFYVIYIYIYMHIHTHTHIYIYTHTYIHTYIHTPTHTYIYLYIHLFTIVLRHHAYSPAASPSSYKHGRFWTAAVWLDVAVSVFSTSSRGMLGLPLAEHLRRNPPIWSLILSHPGSSNFASSNRTISRLNPFTRRSSSCTCCE